MSKCLAAVVSQPGREACLELALLSLRPQVDTLCCYWNGSQESIPQIVHQLADEKYFDTDNQAGDTGNLFWSNKAEGYDLYLSCDDDLEYAPTYGSIMRTWVERWHGQALCTTHGLQFRPHTPYWKKRVVWTPPIGTHVRQKGKDIAGGTAPERIRWHLGWVRQVRWDQPTMNPRWVHQPGSGVMAWNPAAVQVPPTLPEKNNADLLLALWAYRHHQPVCAIPHGGWETKNILPEGATSIWSQHRDDGFARRNQLITGADWSKTFEVATNGDSHAVFAVDTPTEALPR